MPAVALVLHPHRAIAGHVAGGRHGCRRYELRVFVASLVALCGNELGVNGFVRQIEEVVCLSARALSQVESIIMSSSVMYLSAEHVSIDVQAVLIGNTTLAEEADPVIEAGLRLLSPSPMCHLPINAVEYPACCRCCGKNGVPAGIAVLLSTILCLCA